MKGMHWIGFVAARYVSRGRRNSPSPVFSVLGIATGVLALTVIISVMNGFQLGFIESILEISSFHLRLEGIPPTLEAGITARISALPEVVSVLPFRELNVLLRGRPPNPRGALIRGIPADALMRDPGLAGRLEIEEGYFDLGESGNIVLGAELARHLSLRAGDKFNLLSITGGFTDLEDNAGRTYTVTGIFRSGFYEYDLGWGFAGLETVSELLDSAVQEEPAELSFPAEDEIPGEPEISAKPFSSRDFPVLGIKLRNRWQDRQAMVEIRKLLLESGVSLNDSDFTLSSWRDYNRAFFGALRTEKLLMFILVGLIFVVVALNIFQAQRRTVLERREEICLLRALGASDVSVRLVFAWDGFIIGFTGAGLGLGLGLLVAFNIPAFFSFLEITVNYVIYIINFISGWRSGAGEFSVFSPQIFYIKEIPSRVIPHEAVLIFLFGFFSALIAAWFASGKISGTRPAEVLRYE